MNAAARLMDAVLQEFQVQSTADGPPAGARSGAGVRRVRTEDGRPAYLKITPTGSGVPALLAARRELTFYRTLRPMTPVRTPELLRSRETEDGIALLLTDEGDAVEAAAWQPAWWADLGRQLAALHSMESPADSIWRRPDPLVAALNEPDLDVIERFWSGSLPWLPTAPAAVAGLVARLGAEAQVFTHGDCHLGNLLPTAHGISFCDWQAAGIGRPAADLALLSVRATPNGTVIPSALVDAYTAAGPFDRRHLERALLLEELAILVFQWPPFARYNSPLGISRIRDRTRMLAQRWLGSNAPHRPHSGNSTLDG